MKCPHCGKETEEKPKGDRPEIPEGEFVDVKVNMEGESPKAYRATLVLEPEEKNLISVWIPKSQVTYNAKDHTLRMPAWLLKAKKEGK